MFLAFKSFGSDGSKRTVLINTEHIKEIAFENYDDSLQTCDIIINYIDGTSVCFGIDERFSIDAADRIIERITDAMAAHRNVVFLSDGFELTYKALYHPEPESTLLHSDSKYVHMITREEWHGR